VTVSQAKMDKIIIMAYSPICFALAYNSFLSGITGLTVGIICLILNAKRIQTKTKTNIPNKNVVLNCFSGSEPLSTFPLGLLLQILR